MLAPLLPLALLAAFLTTPLAAQPADSLPDRSAWIGLVLPGSTAADRARVASIRQPEARPFSLLTSPSALLPPDSSASLRLVAPDLTVANNSAIPFSQNDGAMWAGRGLTSRIMVGVYGHYGPVTVLLAPQLIRAQNRGFEFLQQTDPALSPMLPPWRIGETSADIPLRFGTLAYTQFDLGQSTLMLRAGPVAFGASTEEQWWGPGIRNALVLSNNAGGVPHAFLRTARPLRTRIGQIEARWLVGALTESLYFDTIASNDLRSFSAAAATLSPAFEPNLTLGVARSVYAPAPDRASVLARGAEVFTRWSAPDSTDREPREHLTALFGRWVFPEAGLEVHGEWARTRMPISLRDLLVAPNHTQGYTVGGQWVQRGSAEGGGVRLQAEATMLEKTPTYRQRYTPGFYVSRFVPQGYTHRGQVVGAAIGPGGSSQWVALDFLWPARSLGAFATRIRWDEDAFFSRPNGDRYYAHDVSGILGVRASGDVGAFTISGSLALEHRYNFLFQNTAYDFGSDEAVDVRNLQLRLTLAPRIFP